MLSNFLQISNQVPKQMLTELNLSNIHEAPRIIKIVLNMSVKEATKNSKAVVSAMKDLTLIAGQKPIYTIAKRSISGFSLRKGMKIGCKVTLRKKRMYDFLERLVITALPRIKDFQGFGKKNFDGMGNLNFGISEHIVFPEIEYDKVDSMKGLNVSIITSSYSNANSKKLLEKFYLPFYD